jgi:hypothetical protein
MAAATRPGTAGIRRPATVPQARSGQYAGQVTYFAPGRKFTSRIDVSLVKRNPPSIAARAIAYGAKPWQQPPNAGPEAEQVDMRAAIA